MRIAIIGGGSVGGNLALGWVKRGHVITFGTRDPASARLTPLLAETGATAALPTEAVRGAEVVVPATPWDVTVGMVGDSTSLAR